MGKSKQFIRPPKKAKPSTVLETADDFQEAADAEEEAGGKHRAGDPAKSGRAFLRALDIYDQGLNRYPNDFDLAYNKARLQLEITQQPVLVEQIGVPLLDLLRQTLQSHRHALTLNGENPDLLFNTAQVLISLSEHLSEESDSLQAIPFLQEALELLSSCLSRQELLLEQQKADFEDLEQGGVKLDPDEKLDSTPASAASEQTASVEIPTTPSDLLDTVHASLSALTTLTSIVEQSALQLYGDLAHTLTEEKAPSYVSLLPADLQDAARFSILVDRAIFIAAFADAQYSFYMIELDTYLQRLDTFDIHGKNESAHALCSEAEARTEFAHSALDRFESSPDLPAEICWKQLSLAQDLYSKATKLDTEDALERKADVYESKGNVELLRHRLVTIPNVVLSKAIKGSAATLIQNAQTFYKGGTQLARANGDSELENKAKQRWVIAADIGSVLYGVEPKTPSPFDGNSPAARGHLLQALRDCVVDEGLIAAELGEEIAKRVEN